MPGQEPEVTGGPSGKPDGLRIGQWVLGIIGTLVVAFVIAWGSYTLGRADAALERAGEAKQEAGLARSDASAALRESAELRNDIRALVGRIDQLLTDRRRVSAGGT